MKLSFKILILFSVFTLACIGQNNDNTRSMSKYDYSLEIVEHNLAQNDRVLNKYYMNKVWGELVIDSAQILNIDKIYYVEYEGDSTIKNQIAFSLTNIEIDSVFTLIKDLFYISDQIGIRKNESDFDEGKYAILKFELDNYYTRYWISINLGIESINREKYFKLKDYLNKLITAYNKG